MIIGEALVVELRARFGREAFKQGELPEEIAVFPQAHPAVGSVIVRDDGNEATVTIGTITHGHFNNFDKPLEQAAPEVAKQVADFLEQLFAGRVLLWKSRTNLSGGWEGLGEGEEARPRWGAKTFLWNGPVT